jgi:ferredoxin
VRIEVDGEKCLRYAQCVLEAPEVFVLDESGPSRVRDGVAQSHLELAQVAADLCPMQAITVEP